MQEAEILNHGQQALMLVLILTLPPIIVAALVGTLVSLVQALTQIQEQTISFAFKLIAVIVTLFATMGWIGTELIGYAHHAFDSIEHITFHPHGRTDRLGP